MNTYILVGLAVKGLITSFEVNTGQTGKQFACWVFLQQC